MTQALAETVKPAIKFADDNDDLLEVGGNDDNNDNNRNALSNKEALLSLLPPTLTFATFNIRYAAGSFLISGSYLRRLGLSIPGRRTRLITKHLRRAARAFSSNETNFPAPHIIALQEADYETLRAGKLHIARELARQLQMNYAHAASDLPRTEPEQPKRWWLDFEEHIAPSDTGDTGVAILSRLAFVNPLRIELPCAVCRWRPRTAIVTTFDFPRRRLHVYNAHISTLR